jgi:hypothetical protein
MKTRGNDQGGAEEEMRRLTADGIKGKGKGANEGSRTKSRLL